MKNIEIKIKDDIQDILKNNGIVKISDKQTNNYILFDIIFVDYEIQNNRIDGKLCDNMDFFMPLIRNKLYPRKIESFFRDCNNVSIYVENGIKYKRLDKLNEILNK